MIPKAILMGLWLLCTCVNLNHGASTRNLSQRLSRVSDQSGPTSNQKVTNSVQVTTLTSSVTIVPSHLTRSAPYAIESDRTGPNSMRSIVFRLSLNHPSQNQTEEDNDPWTFKTKNGTLIGARANLNLKKLLDALEYNNYTSEVKFDHNDTSLVNLTIQNVTQSEKIDSLLLDELLVDANSAALLNGSTILKDNHRYEARRLVKVKPLSLNPESLTVSPPIRAAIEMVAENYTVKKIAEEANIFAIKLLNQLNIEKLGARNLVQAPFSVYQGLTLLLNGAMGDTVKEMEKVLLGSQSSYENTKLIYDQDRPRLMASLSEVIRYLQLSATHHLRPSQNGLLDPPMNPYVSDTPEQHLIVANNLLFAPNAFEISPEFTNTLSTYYNNTVLSKIEIGSTESVQMINSWIRSATAGVIPSVLHKKETFDEFNVMALLCTSWLSQEWKDTFQRVASPLRSSVRLKAHGRALGLPSTVIGKDENLLEFVDDDKGSHFVEYIRSRPSANINHYHSLLNGIVVDVVSVPFKHSNHQLIALTPIGGPSANATQQLVDSLAGQQSTSSSSINTAAQSITNLSSNLTSSSISDLPDSSLLSKLISALASNPRKALRNLWNIVAPEIITKQTLHTIQQAQQKSIVVDERVVMSNLPPLVQLTIPVIRSEADMSISAALNHLGLVNSFDPNQANFIGINGHPFNYHNLHLSNVITKTTFNLNERGINYDKTIKTLEALRIFPERSRLAANKEAALEIEDEDDDDGARNQDLIEEVKLQKPFMYIICDLRTKLILYTGVVRNPDQEGA